jgi:hypothetical protein
MSIHNSMCPDSGCESTEDTAGSGEPRLKGEEPERASHSRHTSPTGMFNPYYTGRPRSPNTTMKHEPINRQEIIQRIKSRENGSRPSSPELERPSSSSGWKGREAIPLPPVIDSTLARPRSREEASDNLAAGMQIERPRSALHSGDFREREVSDAGFGRFTDVVREEQQLPILSTSHHGTLVFLLPHFDKPGRKDVSHRHHSQTLSLKDLQGRALYRMLHWSTVSPTSRPRVLWSISQDLIRLIPNHDQCLRFWTSHAGIHSLQKP